MSLNVECTSRGVVTSRVWIMRSELGYFFVRLSGLCLNSLYHTRIFLSLLIYSLDLWGLIARVYIKRFMCLWHSCRAQVFIYLFFSFYLLFFSFEGGLKYTCDSTIYNNLFIYGIICTWHREIKARNGWQRDCAESCCRAYCRPLWILQWDRTRCLAVGRPKGIPHKELSFLRILCHLESRVY